MKQIRRRSHLSKWRRMAFRKMAEHLPEQKGLTSFQKNGKRLKSYVDPYFDALEGVNWNEVTATQLREVKAFFQSAESTLDKPFLTYVGELLIAAKEDKPSRLFEGLVLDCRCGGKWTLKRHTDKVQSWRYQCDSCESYAHVDISGFPKSLPAAESVRLGRVRLHEEAASIVGQYEKFTMNDLYFLLSLYTGSPIGYTHFGYLQTDDAIDEFDNALQEIASDLAIYEISGEMPSHLQSAR
ncbi:hypothetical protein [Vibrio mediterranei]|uniref:hypothetical protein n=1 Tax=Vibrio mediterranei TaxID=689 RepID=UPI00406762E3